MKIFEELIKDYDKNKELIGKRQLIQGNYEKSKPREIRLEPVSFMEFSAPHGLIEITVSKNGDFESADTLGDYVLVPRTNKSANRGSNKSSHPLFDQVQYVCQTVESKQKHHSVYMALVKDFCNSKYTFDRLQSVYAYIKKDCIMNDLQNSGIFTEDKVDLKRYISFNVHDENPVRLEDDPRLMQAWHHQAQLFKNIVVDKICILP